MVGWLKDPLDTCYRDNFWLRTIGPEYIKIAFQAAREADPTVQLFYNDYGAEGLNSKAGAVFQLVTKLEQAGLVDGVGLQTHVRLEQYPDPEDVAGNIERLASLGLDVHITEMDVAISQTVMEDESRIQAEIYRDILNVCLAQDACTSFVMWGFTDAHSWLYYFYDTSPPDEAPLILDSDYNPKPAYWLLRSALAE